MGGWIVVVVVVAVVGVEYKVMAWNGTVMEQALGVFAYAVCVAGVGTLPDEETNWEVDVFWIWGWGLRV
ncbi:uncharacterized protein EAE98_011846 [Botrytis deweyae]|uniref:Uncharacterized protein n=1 Tax=Botrytis deweyae TaxID=2478750 RepID=A0ABQ7I4K3_9HELO|nr:uncharacterized protein EAE98_011846 [Botrytis deweyae]KAF7911731.1 hypothetical protein EAE98_011846 [Botrytis deweyae]